MSSPRSESSDSPTRSPAQTQTDDSKPCWECLRRRIVCDKWQPVCNKCQLAGIVCPGYRDQKPLTWLTPGKVLSRPRKRKNPAAARKGPGTKERKDRAKSDALVVARGDADYSKVSHILELPDDTVEMFEAVYYYNVYVFPELVKSHLGPSAFMVSFPQCNQLSASQRHILITFAVSHRLLQLPNEVGLGSSPELASRLHHHRGLAIHALNDEIATEEGRCSDSTISSVLIFMFSDVQQAVSGNWRTHASGVASMFALRGGIEQVAVKSKVMRPAILSFIVSAIMGNTTTPAADQITANAQRDILDLLVDLYNEILFPVFPCPLYLFLEIVNINDLRYRFSTAPPMADLELYVSEANELLERIVNFSPETWAKSNESFFEEWLLMARISQSAVFLYCVSSLRALLVPVPVLKLKHQAQLLLLLKTGLESQRLKRCIMWPLVVAGAGLVDSSLEEREWVDKRLLEMSQIMGTYSPLIARVVLKKFWYSGKTEWDECFDEPRIFIS